MQLNLSVLKKMGISKLNDFQEKALEVISSTDKNVILKAPTGVGKTELAIYLMLTTPGRIIYMSPLKALSYQIYTRIQNLDNVQYVTGDEYIDPPDITSRIVITTYEKMDSILKHKVDLKPSLLIVDEIHNINDRPAVENVLVYALDREVRVIGMSATVGGISKLKKWLDAEIVEYNERKIPLYVYLKVAGSRYVYGDPKYAKEIASDPLLFAWEKQKPVMIFVRSRRRALEVYEMLEEKYGKEFKDKAVVFHGGLEKARREEILRQIENKEKLIVISTTALGQGVNLPIWMVIFYDDELPIVEDGRLRGWRMLTKNEFDQIAGRAGRPKYDTEGIVVVLAKSEYEVEKKRAVYFEGDNEEITGNNNIYDFVMFSLVLGAKTKDEIISFLDRSLSFAGIKNVDDILEELIASNLVKEEDGKYSLTEIGETVMKSYLDVESAAYYLPQLKRRDQDSYLSLICNSPAMVKASRGMDTFHVLKQWIDGFEPDLGFSFTKKDFFELRDIAKWQAYSLYKLISITKEGDSSIPFMLYQRLEYGVPEKALELARLKQITRREAVALVEAGITTKEQMCEKKLIAENIIGEEKWAYYCL